MNDVIVTFQKNFNLKTTKNLKSKKYLLQNTKNFYPLMDCRFNIRQCLHDFILLEDHLNHPKLRCDDCIIKHLSKCSALMNEAISLKHNEKYIKLIHKLEDFILKMQYEYVIGTNPLKISQMIRHVRKKFLKYFFFF
jgi:hypothetical protein